MVEYASKLFFGVGATQEGVGIDAGRMRRERAEKVKKIMTREGIATLLITGVPPVRYLTGFFWREFQPHLSYTLFFAEHDPIIFAHAGSYQQAPDLLPWIKHWRIGRAWLQGIGGPEVTREEAALFAKEIFADLKDRGLAKEKVGIVGFDEAARDALRSLGVALVDGAQVLLDASTTKTQDEINCLKVVASICSVGWQTVLETVKPGVTDGELRIAITNAMAKAGSEVPRCGIGTGPMSFERNMTLFPRRIEYGDMMYVALCGNSFMGYTSCLYRSFIVGRKPTAKENDWFKRMNDRLNNAIEASRVGNTTADAAKAFDPASRWGYKDEAEVLSIEIGHGVGLMNIESPAAVNYSAPVINRQWSIKHPQPFEEGMVIAYESAEGEHQVGGVRNESMIVITKNGPEVIDHFPRDEILVI
ncbi:MAG: M24 family metallopeptidase [Thermodesulfobacteriota bacterium]